MPEEHVGGQAAARVSRLILQATCLVYVLWLWFRGFLRAGISGDLLLCLIIVTAWVALIFMLRRATATLGWNATRARVLGSAADSYFLLVAVGLCTADSALMARTLFVWLFAAALVDRPAAMAAALLAGSAAYCTIALDNPASLHAGLVFAGGFIGGLCGMSWKMTLPLLWRALKHMLDEERQAYASGEKSEEEEELDPFAAAGFGRPAEPAAVALPFVQQATSEPQSPEGGAQDHVGELEELKLIVREKETALLAMQEERDRFAGELEGLRLQLETAASGAGGPGHDTDVAKLELELANERAARQQAEAKQAKLQTDLEEAERELARLYGMDKSISADSSTP